MTSVEDILRYLLNKFDDIPVQPSHLISNFGLSIPLLGREDLLNVANNLYNVRWENRETRDRNCHKIGVIGGCSGMGKSRALIEIARSIPQWKKNEQWSFELVISYNNGNPPHIDRYLFDKIRGRSCAPTALSLRILFFSFVAGKKCLTSFECFVRMFPENFLNVLTPEFAIQVVTLHLSKQHGHSNGVIFIGLDEVNYLLDSDYNGEDDKRGFLKETLVALGNVMLIPDKFVFTVIAGTTVLPIHIVFEQSGLLIQPFPIYLLNTEHCENMVSRMVPSLPQQWKLWRVCRAFRTLLADFASMPRKAEQLMNFVNEEVKRGISLADVDYDFISSQLMGTFAPSNISEKLAEQIVSDILLSTSVRRDDVVKVPNNLFTYGQLEEKGSITIATCRDTHLLVQMPYSQFRVLVQRMNGGDPLTKSLRKMCNLVDSNEEFGGLNWQTFEELHCNMEASREMLMARRSMEEPVSSLGEFYCTPIGNDFDFILRSVCTVAAAHSRFPSPDWRNLANRADEDHLETASMSYVKNVEGAVFDSFTVRKIHEEGGVMLFCGQQKRYFVASVGVALIDEEVGKVRTFIPEGVPFKLIVIATKVSLDVFDNLPEECVVVTGPALEKFYSVFSARANLHFGCLTQININTASKSELKTINRICDSIASSIIASRQKEEFISWNDVLIKIRRIPISAKENFTY